MQNEKFMKLKLKAHFIDKVKITYIIKLNYC